MTSQTEAPEVHVKYRPDIDGLRALAVLSVVLFHAGVGFIPGGYIGVDVFFVISGYLITGIILKGLSSRQFSFAGFYARRVKRILPALLLVMAACWVFGLIALLPDELGSLGRHILAGATFSSNFQLWQEAGYFDTEAEFKPLLHLWSLGVEEQFYILWPLLFFLAWKYRIRMLLLVGFIVLLSFGLNVYWTGTDGAMAFFLPHTRFWELAIGGWLAAVQADRGSWPNRILNTLLANKERANVLAASGVAGLLAGMLAMDKDLAFPGYWAAVPTVSAALIIAAGPHTWVNRKLLAHPVAVFIGLISYPLYLWHWPLLSFSGILTGGEAPTGLKLLLVLCAFFLAWGTYKFIEKPVRHRATPKYIPSARVVPILGVLLIVVGAVGERTHDRDGVPFGNKPTIDPFVWKGAFVNDAACRNSLNYHGTFCKQTPGGAKPSIALIGDSHANHYFPGLSQYAAKNGKVLLHLGEGGCLPFLGVDTLREGKKQRKANCVKNVEEALQIAINSDSVDTVILAFRGPAYFTGEGYGKEENRKLSLIRANDSVPDGGNHALFHEAFEQTVQAIEGAGKKVVLVLDNPELGFRPQSRCFTQPLLVARSNKPCALPRSEVEARQAGFRKAVDEIIGRHPKVRILDPMDFLCDKDFCYAMIGGKVLYRDDDHFSLDGSLYIASHFAL